MRLEDVVKKSLNNHLNFNYQNAIKGIDAIIEDFLKKEVFISEVQNYLNVFKDDLKNILDLLKENINSLKLGFKNQIKQSDKLDLQNVNIESLVKNFLKRL